MEEKGQYRSQCDREIEQCRIITTEIDCFTGPVMICRYNNDPLARLCSRNLNVRMNIDGTVITEIIVLN